MLPTTSNPPMCTLKELKDGTYDLADIAMMNDWLLVCADNQLIAKEAAEAERNGR